LEKASLVAAPKRTIVSVKTTITRRLADLIEDARDPARKEGQIRLVSSPCSLFPF